MKRYGLAVMAALTCCHLSAASALPALSGAEVEDAQRTFTKETRLEHDLTAVLNTQADPMGGALFRAYFGAAETDYRETRTGLLRRLARLKEIADKRRIKVDADPGHGFSPERFNAFWYGPAGTVSRTELEKELNALAFLRADESDAEFKNPQFLLDQLMVILDQHVHYFYYLLDVDNQNADNQLAQAEAAGEPYVAPKQVLAVDYPTWKRDILRKMSDAEFFFEHPEEKAKAARAYREERLKEQAAAKKKK
jgi:hypothetical protein